MNSNKFFSETQPIPKWKMQQLRITTGRWYTSYNEHKLFMRILIERGAIGEPYW